MLRISPQESFAYSLSKYAVEHNIPPRKLDAAMQFAFTFAKENGKERNYTGIQKLIESLLENPPNQRNRIIKQFKSNMDVFA